MLKGLARFWASCSNPEVEQPLCGCYGLIRELERLLAAAESAGAGGG